MTLPRKSYSQDDFDAAVRRVDQLARKSAGDRIVARVTNGGYSIIVVGDSYEEIIEMAESWVEEQTGHRWTPTGYTDLSSCYPAIITSELVE